MIGVLSSLILWQVAKMFQTMQTDLEDMSPRFFLRRKKLLVESLMWLVIFIINFVPMLTLIVTAFMKGIGGGYGLDNMTLENFAFVFSNAKSFNAIKNSIFLGITTALICVVLGTIVAYLMVRRPSVLIRVVEGIISVPYSIPGIILGLALILTWARPLPIINRTIYATVFMLLVSYVVRFTSLQIRNSTTGVLQTDVSMEEAAEICGASGFKKVELCHYSADFPCYHLRHGPGVSECTDGADYLFPAVVRRLRDAGRRHLQLYLCGIHHLRLRPVHSCLHHDSGAGTAVPGSLCHPAS